MVGRGGPVSGRGAALAPTQDEQVTPTWADTRPSKWWISDATLSCPVPPLIRKQRELRKCEQGAAVSVCLCQSYLCQRDATAREAFIDSVHPHHLNVV